MIFISHEHSRLSILICKDNQFVQYMASNIPMKAYCFEPTSLFSLLCISSRLGMRRKTRIGFTSRLIADINTIVSI